MFCGNVFIGTLDIAATADRGPGTWNYSIKSGIVYVENQSYNKRVGLRMNVNGVWRDFYAGYTNSLMTGGGSLVEQWTLKVDFFATSDLLKPKEVFQLAAFYQNLDWGVWYWDNNYGKDYFVTPGSG
jgi:hypothetical protein